MLGLWCGLSGWLGVHAWRRLWRVGRTPRERAIYDRGVRGWGGQMLIAMPLMMGVVLWFALDTARDPNAWIVILVGIFMTIPLAMPVLLWAGYALGSMFADKLGQGSDGESAKNGGDLPPIA